MGIKLLQNNFTTGAVSPQVRARVDLAKYEGACQVIKNAIVLAQGGVTKRPGTRFVANAQDGRLIPFRYSPSQTYALLFTDYRVWFFSNGGTVAVGDTPYSIESPYTLNDLFRIKYAQTADVMYLAHPDYPPKKLIRYGHTDWKFEDVAFTPPISAPDGLEYKKTGFSNPDGTLLKTVTEYKVSAVDADGVESLPSEVVSVNTLSTWPQGSRVKLTWNAVSGASRYEVYKNMHGWFEWAGSTKTTKFTDDNIEPDGDFSPKEYRDPFHPPSVPQFAPYTEPGPSDPYLDVCVSAINSAGAESVASATKSVPVGGDIIVYPQSDTEMFNIYFRNHGDTAWKCTVLSKDTDFEAIKVYTSRTGGVPNIRAIYVRDPEKDKSHYFLDDGQYHSAYAWEEGYDYTGTNPSFLYTKTQELKATTKFYKWQESPQQGMVQTSYKAEAGYTHLSFPVEGARASSPISSVAEQYPGAVGIYQQRLMYGGTKRNPQTVWLSETGAFDSMAVSEPMRDDSAIAATVDTRQRNEVRHFVSLSDAFVLTDVTEFKMSGREGTITPGNISFRPQSYWGSSHVPPLVIGTTILMVDASGRVVRDVHYNLQEDGYSGDNRTILAEHFFPVPIRDWSYQQTPFNTVYVVREDGKLLTFTYIREQEVWAWAEHESSGAEFRSVCTVRENGNDLTYFLVKRGERYFIEEQVVREWGSSSEDSWFVDCGLDYTGDWEIQTVTGLDHLEGQTVVGVADGSYVPPRVVEGGQVTLDLPAKHITLGLGYGMEVITVDPDIKGNDGTRFGSRKTLGPVTFEFLETAGMSAGADSNHMELLKVPTIGNYSEPIVLYSGKLRSAIPGYARDEASVRFTSDDPFPATVLAVRTEVNVE